MRQYTNVSSLRSPQTLRFCGGPDMAAGGGWLLLHPAPPAPPATVLRRRRWASAASEQSLLVSVSASGENAVRSLAPPFPANSSILRGPRVGGWRGMIFASSSPSSPSSSSCHSAATASLGIRRVGAKSAYLCFRLRRKRRPLPCSSFSHKLFDFAGAPGWRLAEGWFLLHPAPPAPPATVLPPRRWASAASEQSPLASVSASGENAVRSLAPPFPANSSILRGPRYGGWRGDGFA